MFWHCNRKNWELPNLSIMPEYLPHHAYSLLNIPICCGSMFALAFSSSLEMEFASLKENKMQLNLRQQLQNKTWSIAELYLLQEGCRVVRTAASPPANRVMLHWCSSSCRETKPWTAELHHLQERSCKVVTTAASPPANRVMLHIEAAAIAEKQNFDCRVSSNYEREREREREM